MIEIPYWILGEDGTIWPDDRDPKILSSVESRHWAAVLARTEHERAFASHSHGDHRISLVVEGAEKLWTAGCSSLESAGALSLTPADTEHHSVLETDHLTFLSIAIDGRVTLGHRAELFPNATQISTVWRIYRELVQYDRPCALELDALCLTLEMSLRDDSKEVERTHPGLLAHAYQQIMDAPQAPHSSTTLAEQFGVHRSHLARSFMQAFGCSVHEMLIARRVERALKLIADPECSLAQIATDCGFYDQSHFGRFFKRMMKSSLRDARSLLSQRRHHGRRYWRREV